MCEEFLKTPVGKSLLAVGAVGAAWKGGQWLYDSWQNSRRQPKEQPTYVPLKLRLSLRSSEWHQYEGQIKLPDYILDLDQIGRLIDLSVRGRILTRTTPMPTSIEKVDLGQLMAYIEIDFDGPDFMTTLLSRNSIMDVLRGSPQGALTFHLRVAITDDGIISQGKGLVPL